MYGIALYIIVHLYSWISVCGILIFVIIHEMGHAVIAKHYGAFRGFSFTDGMLVTKIESNIMPKNVFRFCASFGMIMNLLTAPLIMPLFSYTGENLFYNINYNAISLQSYVIIVLAVGSLDIYCIFKGGTLHIKGDDEK